MYYFTNFELRLFRTKIQLLIKAKNINIFEFLLISIQIIHDIQEKVHIIYKRNIRKTKCLFVFLIKSNQNT